MAEGSFGRLSFVFTRIISGWPLAVREKLTEHVISGQVSFRKRRKAEMPHHPDRTLLEERKRLTKIKASDESPGVEAKNKVRMRCRIVRNGHGEKPRKQC